MIHGVLANQRTTTDGSWFRATDLPFQPKPVQARLPIVVGTGGPRMSRLTARFADEWNTWGNPTELRRRTEIFNAACEREGRDPKSVYRSAQALIFITDDSAAAAKITSRAPDDRSLVGNLDQLTELIAGYAAAGIDEFIVPDFTLGATHAERLESHTMLHEHVVATLG